MWYLKDTHDGDGERRGSTSLKKEMVFFGYLYHIVIHIMSPHCHILILYLNILLFLLWNFLQQKSI